MATSLILSKRIETTLAKAKELRKYVEPLINRTKDDTTHSRRVVFSYLQSKEAIKELFGIVAEKVAERPGGYTRIIKLGSRLGDNAETCLIELVDFNELLLQAAEADERKKTRRSRRSSNTTKKAEATTAPAAVVETPAAIQEVAAEEPKADEAPAEEDENKTEA
jgi:large subunit ribosomal protein L17